MEPYNETKPVASEKDEYRGPETEGSHDSERGEHTQLKRTMKNRHVAMIRFVRYCSVPSAFEAHVNDTVLVVSLELVSSWVSELLSRTLVPSLFSLVTQSLVLLYSV